jgi:hypothetical protein
MRGPPSPLDFLRRKLTDSERVRCYNQIAERKTIQNIRRYKVEMGHGGSLL